MSLLDEARAAQKVRGPACTVSILLGQSNGLRAEIDELINADVFASTASSVLKEHNLALSPDAIRRHRKRGTPTGCQCQP